MVGLSVAARRILLFVQKNGDSDAEIVASGVNLLSNEVLHANIELSDNDLAVLYDPPNVVELTDAGIIFEPIFDDDNLDERIDGYPPITQLIIGDIRKYKEYPSKQYLHDVLGYSAAEIEIATDELIKDAFIQSDKIQ